MIQITRVEDLDKNNIFYMFNKKQQRYKIMGRYILYSLYCNFIKHGEKNIFDSYDIYKIQSREEYDMLKCMTELVN